MAGESQKALASRAKVTESVLKLLENPARKQPDPVNLKKVKLALEGKGVVFLPANDQLGEGVRFSSPLTTRPITQYIRHARALLDFSIDQLAELSGVGRISVGRIERAKLTRMPEDAVRKLRQVLYDEGVAILPEEVGIGGGVRFRAPEFAERTLSGVSND
jgi:transcriptional regulator with XRE-family HTH domain